MGCGVERGWGRRRARPRAPPSAPSPPLAAPPPSTCPGRLRNSGQAMHSECAHAHDAPKEAESRYRKSSGVPTRPRTTVQGSLHGPAVSRAPLPQGHASGLCWRRALSTSEQWVAKCGQTERCPRILPRTQRGRERGTVCSSAGLRVASGHPQNLSARAHWPDQGSNTNSHVHCKLENLCSSNQSFDVSNVRRVVKPV